MDIRAYVTLLQSQNYIESLENFSNYFCDLRNTNQLIVKNLKTALNRVAGALNTLLRNAFQLPARGAWEKLICFPYLGLAQPDTSPRSRPQLTLAKKIKNQFVECTACTCLPELSPGESFHVQRRSYN